MNTNQNPPIRIPEAELRKFCEQIFIKLGVPENDAKTTTDILISADLRGIESHGVARLSRYVDGLKSGSIKPTNNSQIVTETKITALIDGGQSLGQVVAHQAMELAIQKAKETGLSAVTVRNSNHYGIAAYYSMMALKENFIGINMTNAAPLIVPTFGKQAILGTNPISFTAPTKNQKPFVLDMATSVVPRGKLEVLERANKPMKMGWAVDETGKESTDAGQVLKSMLNRLGGGLLPIGGSGEDNSGHKGYGLAFVVDILCGVLSGAATGLEVYSKPQQANVGHFFLVIDPAAFRPLDEFTTNMDRLIQELKQSPKADLQTDIYIPGEKSYKRTETNLNQGAPIRPEVASTLSQIGNDLGIEWIQA